MRSQRTKTATHARCNRVLARMLAELSPRPARLCDLGCGDGSRTLLWAHSAGIHGEDCVGVDVSERKLACARVAVHRVDLESEPVPLADASVDLVVVQQVLEHVKNVHHVLAEASRLLPSGGFLAVGAPNLASLHNRLLLVAGRQPTTLRTVSEHVRGFTWIELRRLLELFGFRILRSRGVGFYPLRPDSFGAPLERLLPRLAVFQCHVCVKHADVAPAMLQLFDLADTDYWLPRADRSA